MNSVRSNLGGTGVQTSALGFGGFVPPGNTTTAVTESWNGTNWTEVNDLNQARLSMGSAGISNTSALAIGGDTFPGSNPARAQALTESWNGTNWTEVNDLNTKRFVLAGAGTQTSALAFGGYDFSSPAGVAVTESWNGTNWTEVNDLNTARYYIAGSGTDNTSALAFGGTTGTLTGATEEWNGASWSEQNDLSTARQVLAGNGTTTSSLAYGGGAPSNTTATEEWNVPSTTVKTLTD
ncbi:MAG: hypothetical protein CM15mV60_450 [uncultured marine virus]|nr:MAG: hypothetical protein CM15mV60_450 [uncultured marine virus]